MRHCLTPLDFSTQELDQLFDLAADIEKYPEKYAHACDGKKIATLFYEPSTRTRLSFEAAMMNLGGKALGFAGATQSSAAKGESVADTIQVISCFADIAAIRHNKEGAAYVAAQHSNIPVINAGDGGHEHPTQTLLDLYAIRKTQGSLDGLKVNMVGDLKYSRTTHSLLQALSLFDTRMVFTAPEELRTPKEYLEILDAKGIPYEETSSLEDHLQDCDILYMTRVQQERFPSVEQYRALKDSYILSAGMLKGVKPGMKILHPLPRVNEISTDVDSTPHAYYFQQAGGGMYVRMAVIAYLLGYR